MSAKPAAALAETTRTTDVSYAQLAADIRSLIDQATGWMLTHWLQIAIAGAVGAVIVAILYGVRLLGVRLCRVDTAGVSWRGLLGRVLAVTRLWFMVALAARLVVASAYPPAGVQATIVVLFTIAAALQAALWAREFVLGLIEHRAGGDVEHGSLGSAINIIRVLVTFGLFAIAIILILDNLGVNVTGLIAGLGIGGIAIGFAAQGVFADLFAALAIIFDRPFKRGDAIMWSGQSGTVERIGLKTTRIRAVSGEQVIIANSDLLKQTIHNMARLDRRRTVLTFGIGYYTDPDTIEALPAMLKDLVQACDNCVYVRSGITAFGDSGIAYELQIDVKTEQLSELFDARHAVCVAMIKRFAAERIDFNWPTQLSILGRADGSPKPEREQTKVPAGA